MFVYCKCFRGYWRRCGEGGLCAGSEWPDLHGNGVVPVPGPTGHCTAHWEPGGSLYPLCVLLHGGRAAQQSMKLMEITLCKNMMHLPCHILSPLNVGFACRCLQRRWVWRRAGTVTSLWPQTEMVTAMVLRPAQVKQDLYMMTIFMVSVSFCLPSL